MRELDPADKVFPVMKFAHDFYVEEGPLLHRLSNADDPSEDEEYEAFLERDERFTKELIARIQGIVSEALDELKEMMLKHSAN